MKIGLIARDNNRGLGIQSWEFFKNIKTVKTLVIEIDEKRIFRERFPKARFVQNRIEDSDLDWLFDGIDCLITFETWYRRDIPQIARERGVKTALQLNFEWFCEEADIYLAPSLWHFLEIPEPKEYLPVPINRDVLKFRKRKKANVFLHNAGNLLGGYDRNGTEVFLKAIPLVKSHIQFIIKSQEKIEGIDDKRVKFICDDNDDYWEQWKTKADVMLMPRRYGGLCLPLNEAMSVGMPVIMTDMSPQNLFLPKELLIKPKSFEGTTIRKYIEMANIQPEDLAKKIDELAGKDITKYSNMMGKIAEAWSWEKLKPKYLKIFKKLCQK